MTAFAQHEGCSRRTGFGRWTTGAIEAKADDQGTKSASGVDMPYLNSRTCSFTLAPVEAGLSPAGTSCCRGCASILLRGTEAPQRAARRRALCGHGVGAVAGHLATESRA